MHVEPTHLPRVLRWLMPAILVATSPALSSAQSDPAIRSYDPGPSVAEPLANPYTFEGADGHGSARAVPEHAKSPEPEYGIMSPRISLRPIIGVLGEARADGESADLDRTFGGAVEVEVPALPFLSFGAEISVMAWTLDSDADLGRNILTNISFVPRLRIPFQGPLMHGAFYVGAPFGMTTSSMSDRFRNEVVGNHVDAGVGFNYGGRAGMQLFVTPRFGFAADVEYRIHNLQHHVGHMPQSDSEVRFQLRQLLVNAGLIFTL
jgi:hypothetical protein